MTDDVLTFGVSGSRDSLTVAQMAFIDDKIRSLPEGSRIVTGCCIGVDAYAARSAYSRGYHVHTVVPADRSRIDPEWRRWCHTFEEMPPETTYRDRNARIVALSVDGLIAFPQYAEDDRRSDRSGTWQTYRIACKANIWHASHCLDLIR